jgi:hypothetical protein
MRTGLVWLRIGTGGELKTRDLSSSAQLHGVSLVR